MYVVATAGHVDHGKSTLVRALTGMEPDRWAEERRRGLTIDLGYAWLTLPGGEQLALVDVPGHERFVPNMLAGLGPVPAVLFVVAADGGWMPQSAEHLAAVDALGVRHGLLAVTRCDLADPGPATRQALGEITRTSLGTVPAVPVSAVTGAGLDRLRSALAGLVGRLRAEAGPARAAAPVRLWIDRSFTIRGAGTVITGTLPAGTVRNNQELQLSPAGATVRVRGLEALGEPAGSVSGTARVALNLRGIAADVPARGMALIEPGRWVVTREADVRIRHRPGEPPPKLPAELLLHVGSARTRARVRLFGSASGADGASGTVPAAGPGVSYARLRLHDPLPLHAGDRVILRDPGAAGLALYGATVLDPFPPALARRGAAAIAVSELSHWPDQPRAADLLGRHKLLRASRLAAAGVADLPAPVARDWLADPRHWAGLRAELPRVVAAFCARDPLAPGMPAEAARAALGLPSRDLVAALTGPQVQLDGAYLRLQDGRAAAKSTAAGESTAASEGTAAGESTAAGEKRAAGGTAGGTAGGAAAKAAGRPADPVAVRPDGLARAAPASLPPQLARGVQAVLDDLADDPFAAPDADRLHALGLDVRALAAAARAGLLLRIADLIVLAPGADEAAARILGALDQPFTTSQARQALRTTRRVAVPLLEYLDRARVTERLPGDLRRLRG